MKISLIVPVYNERRCLPAFLEQLDALPGDWEPLFADGGSTDGSLELLRGRTCISCPKGRAGQMNFAAARATGELLWFVHCDSVLPPGRPPAAVPGGGPGRGLRLLSHRL